VLEEFNIEEFKLAAAADHKEAALIYFRWAYKHGAAFDQILEELNTKHQVLSELYKLEIYRDNGKNIY